MPQLIVRLAAMTTLASAFALSHSAPLAVTRYDTTNGGTGSFTYFDDTYVGTSPPSNNLTPYAPLFGGTGQLTDGIVALSNWHTNPAPYVGWENQDEGESLGPVTTFYFGAPVTINSFTVWFDDSNGAGGVSAPGAVHTNFGSWTIPEPAGSAPSFFTVTGLSVAASSLDMWFTRKSSWYMLSEIGFDGTIASTPVPEPTTIALLGAGILGFGIMRRRKRK